MPVLKIIKKVPASDNPTVQQKNWTPTEIVTAPTTTKDKQKLRRLTCWKYYGIKINKETFDLKKTDWTTIVEAMELKDTEYVVGLDEQLSTDKKPHYHIHFKSEKTLGALQDFKKVAMPNWGPSTKLYPPKERVENFECWAGYAVKENFISHNKLKDILLVEKEAHTQRAYKQSQLNYGALVEEKKQAKKDIQSYIFSQLDIMPIQYEFFPVAVQITRIFRAETKIPPIRSQVERMAWSYLLDKNHKTDEEYVLWMYTSQKL